MALAGDAGGLSGCHLAAEVDVSGVRAGDHWRGRRRLAGAIGAGMCVACIFLGGGAAVANPATTVAYAAGASATMFSGAAFDTCTAPPLSAMSAWLASPYRAVGVYVGGVNRSCAQPELTASWVSAVSELGWRLLPVYKGLQAPCGGKPTDVKIDPAKAAAQGTTAANDAVAAARGLGMVSGSALYDDMETYATGDAACRLAVLKFLSGWTAQVHKLGYVAGVYAQLASGATDLAGVYASGSYARPDALWIARYDGDSALTGWAGVPDTDWTVRQRAKQYRNGHNETYGGVTINIDNDQVDAPVATVPHQYTVTSATPLNARTGPAASYPVVKSYPPGAGLAVVCQAAGGKVGTTTVWDKLADGSYVTDYYVSTPSKTGYSAPLPRCAYPYQVTAAGGLHERAGPGLGYRAVRLLRNGALAWVACQANGSKIGKSRVWDRLVGGAWVTDAHVASPGVTGFSKPVPRC